MRPKQDDEDQDSRRFFDDYRQSAPIGEQLLQQAYRAAAGALA
jgi:hypothetical protein